MDIMIPLLALMDSACQCFAHNQVLLSVREGRHMARIGLDKDSTGYSINQETFTVSHGPGNSIMHVSTHYGVMFLLIVSCLGALFTCLGTGGKVRGGQDGEGGG